MLVISRSICACEGERSSRDHTTLGHAARTSKRLPGYARPMTTLRHALAGVSHVEPRLGRGGMSLVYLARERRLDRRVALKVLAPELAADDGQRRLFLSEARTIARLTHPNIVPIFTVDEIARVVLFFMLLGQR